jgi:hypothetical protein
MFGPESLAVLLLLAEPPSTGDEVPLDIQVPAVLKALGFDRALEPTGSGIVVGIVYDPAVPESVNAKDQVLSIHKELTRLRVKGERVTFLPIAYPTERELSAGGAQALFVTRLPAPSIKALVAGSRAARLLTIAMAPEQVRSGLALGMELEKGRPRFLVNVAAATSAGVSFESSFLDLCRIVEP